MVTTTLASRGPAAPDGHDPGPVGLAIRARATGQARRAQGAQRWGAPSPRGATRHTPTAFAPGSSAKIARASQPQAELRRGEDGRTCLLTTACCHTIICSNAGESAIANPSTHAPIAAPSTQGGFLRPRPRSSKSETPTRHTIGVTIGTNTRASTTTPMMQKGRRLPKMKSLTLQP